MWGLLIRGSLSRDVPLWPIINPRSHRILTMQAPLESGDSGLSNGARIIKIRSVLRKLRAIMIGAFNGPYNGPINNGPINGAYNNGP